MYRVFITVCVILGGSWLLAMSPHFIYAYHIEDAMPLLAGSVSIALSSLILTGIAWRLRIWERLDYITTCLNTAEHEMNNLIMRGWDASGRLKKIEERQSWAKLLPSKSGYKTEYGGLIAGYEKDIMGVKDDKRLLNQTAVLLRYCLRGEILAAQIAIEAHYRNNGKLPYIASGIAELVHLHSFDASTGKFKSKGENWRLVRRAVRQGGFPRRLLVADSKVTWRGTEVLERLTAHHV